ncbi:MAG: hypothetical protein JW709_04170 [Sedimentisphaerales bacterium]|nr:hypothetical protein [Sedimentisphaerales bacterium]
MEKKSQPSVQQAKRPRRRRRRIVLTVVTLLFIIIWSLPYLASSSPGERLALRMANQAGSQIVNFSDMSLTWLGPIRLRELHVEDPCSQAVVDVDAITWSKGLLTALGGIDNFGKVEVDQPRVIIPATALTQKKEKEEKEKEKEPWSDKQPRGRLTVTNGYVRITRADGEKLEITDINTNVNLDSIDKMKGDFRLALAGGGRLQGDFDLAQATAGLEKMQATVNIKTDEPFNLEPFAVLAGADITTGGMAGIEAVTKIENGQVQSDFEMKFAQLKAGRKNERLQPVDVNLTGNVKTAANKIIGTATLSGDIGEITDHFEMPTKVEKVNLDQETLIAALQGEKNLMLPDFSLTSNGNIDLAMLARAVPALLNMRPGLTVQQGRLTLRDIHITGGTQPAAKGGLEIGSIVGSLQKPGEATSRPVTVEPMTADFDVQLVTGKGLQFRQTRLQGAFLDANATGDMQQLNAQFQADLQTMENQLAMLFDYEPRGLSGRLNGTSQLSRREDGWQVQSDVSGVSLAYPGEKGKLEVGKMQLSQNGQITLQEGKVQQYRLDAMNLDVDDAVRVQATGTFSLIGEGLQVKTTVGQLDLQRTSQWLQAWRGEEMTPVKGNLTFQADITQASQSKVLTVRGSGRAANLLVGEATPADAVNVDFGWDQIRWDPAEADLGVTAMELQGRLAQLAGQNTAASEPPLVSAHVDGTVKNIRQMPTLDLKGNYQSSWEQVTRWLHQSFPDMRQNVSLEGSSGGPFTLTGPLRSAADKPAGSGLTGNFSAGWTAAALYGLQFGQAVFAARLQDGVITLPDTTVTAGQGGMNLGGVVDLTSKPTVVRLAGKRNLLVKLPITPATGDQLLSRFNPIFANLTRLQGSINLDTVDLVIPLSKEYAAVAGGSGSLDLREIMMQPGGLLAELLPMDKFADKRIVPVRTEVLNFELKDGGVYYEKFRINIAEVLPLNFRGQVGFDDTVKMWVSVPLTMPLLERILTRAGRSMPPLVSQNLEKITLEIPIIGTRLKPMLDFSAVDVPKLLQQILEGTIQKPLETIFDILNRPKAGGP